MPYLFSNIVKNTTAPKRAASRILLQGTMIRSKIHTAFVTILGCLFMLSCAPRAEKAIPWPFETDKFIFIELRDEEDGHVIYGDFPPGPMIDFPTYMFDPNRGVLASHEINFQIDDTLKVVIGKSKSLRGTAGAGMVSQLYGIYTFPYQTDDLFLRGIDEQGTAHIRYRDERILLRSGEEWVASATRRDTLGVSRERAIAEFTQSLRIIHYGLLEKSDITKW